MAFFHKILRYVHSHLVLEDLLENAAENSPHAIAFQLWQDQGITQRISFQSLLEVVKREGERLKKMGVEKGMRIALIEDNSIDWVIAFFAILHCHATAVLIDPRLSKQDYLNLISLSDPQLLVLGHHYHSKIEELASIPSVIIENQTFHFPSSPLPLKKALDGDPSLAVFIFTSGTTGQFKAVMLDHQALLYAAKGGLEALNDGLGQNVLGILPLTHVYGLVTNLIAPLANGMTVTFLEKLQGEIILKAMEATQTHALSAVPRVINLFAMRIQQELDKKFPKISPFLKRLADKCYHLRVKTGWNLGRFLFYPVHKKFGRHLEVLVSGGSPSDKDLVQFMIGLGFVVLEGYGLSETTGMTCCQNFQDRPKAGSVGKPAPWMKIRIAKNDPLQKEGEILIKGPSVMKGYFRDPVQTEQVLKEGWFYSGDLGHLDNEGDLHITGRIKEIIVTATGQKAMPIDVERRYQNIPGVQELAVFGVSTPPSKSEDIHAAVIVHEELLKDLTSETERYSFIIEKIAKRSESIPSHLRITQVHLVESIPKTTTLKVKRKELTRLFAISTESLKTFTSETSVISVPKENAIELTEKQTFSSSTIQKTTHVELDSKIIELVQKVCELTKKKSTKPLDRSTHFQTDLKFDSLDALELIFALENEFKIRFSPNLEQIHTIGDLQDALASYLHIHTSISPAPSSISIVSKEIETTVIEKLKPQEPAIRSQEPAKNDGEAPLHPQDLTEVEKQIIAITQSIVRLNQKKLNQDITPHTHFQIDLGFDSLLSLDLIFEIEKQFKVSLKDLPMDQIHTIRDLSEFVQKNTQHVANAPPAETGINLHQNFLARAKESAPFSTPKQTQTKKMMSRVAETLYRSYFHLTSTGNSFLPAEPYILCANHCSHLDTLALILATGAPLDSFVALAAKDYFFEGPKQRRWLTSLFNMVPFNRESHPYAMIDNLILCKQILEEKKNLILFPEGTRSLNGQLQPFKSFVGVLGVELGYPLVPVFIHGTHNLLPKGKKIPKPGKIEVAFGPPILANTDKKDVHSNEIVLYHTMTQEVYDRIHELSKKFQGKTNE